jgi:hypothetical protein
MRRCILAYNKLVPIPSQRSDVTRYERRLTFNKPNGTTLADGGTCSRRHRQHESVTRAPHHAPSWRCGLVGLDAYRADAFGVSSWSAARCRHRWSVRGHSMLCRQLSVGPLSAHVLYGHSRHLFRGDGPRLTYRRLSLAASVLMLLVWHAPS